MIHATAADPAEDHAIEALANLAMSEAGLAFPVSKRGLLLARLGRRLRHFGIERYLDYLALVSGPDSGDERREMIAALTTHVSHFFREPHHFQQLRDHVLPPLLRAARSGRRVRLWSAGCAHGQEAFTLAMTVLDLFPDAPDYDIRILATDICSHALARARQGVFAEADRQEIPAAQAARYTRSIPAGFHFTDKVSSLLRFRQHNLHAPWPMSQGFDVIFCRNVLIYFTAPAQEQLLERFALSLSPGGWLFLGHSERATGLAAGALISAGSTAYRLAGHQGGGLK